MNDSNVYKVWEGWIENTVFIRYQNGLWSNVELFESGLRLIVNLSELRFCNLLETQWIFKKTTLYLIYLDTKENGIIWNVQLKQEKAENSRRKKKKQRIGPTNQRVAS